MCVVALTFVLQQQTVATEGESNVSKFFEEFNVVKISWNIVGTLVKAKVLSSVFADIHGIGATACPYLILCSVIWK
jgi:hypothetical protein